MTPQPTERHVCPTCGKTFDQPTYCAGTLTDRSNPHVRYSTGWSRVAVCEFTRKAA